MTNSNIKSSKSNLKKRATEPCAGMHPGGGFIAWPDGRTTESGTEERGSYRAVCRGQRRKGFVAWPERG